MKTMIFCHFALPRVCKDEKLQKGRSSDNDILIAQSPYAIIIKHDSNELKMATSCTSISWYDYNDVNLQVGTSLVTNKLCHSRASRFCKDDKQLQTT